MFLSTFFSLDAIKLYSQCESYYYILTKENFNCQYTEGTICIKTIADWTNPPAECAEYVAEIEYPKGSFIYTDLGDFTLFEDNGVVIKLRAEIELYFDLQTQVCLEGVLQTPGTEFTLRIIHPQTGDIVNGETFYLDNTVVIGSQGGTTSLTAAINDGLLLPASQAETTSQNVEINGELIVDQDYTFYNSTLSMGEGSSIYINFYKKLGVKNTTLNTCNNDNWEGILVDRIGHLDFYNSSIKNANTAIEMKNLSGVNVYNSEFIDNNVGIGCYGKDHPKNILLQFFGNIYLGSSSFSGGDFGIKLENVSGFHNGVGTGFSDMTTGIYLYKTDLNSYYNFFSDCTNGIKVENAPSLVNLNENIFIGTAHGVYVNGAPICNITHYNSFSDCSTAITIKSSELDEVTDIEECSIYDCNFGISGYLKQSRGNIMNNDIQAKFFNVVLRGLEGDQTWATQYNEDMAVTKHGSFITNVLYNNINDGRVFHNSMGTPENGVKIDGGTFNNVGYNDINSDDDRPCIRLNGSDLSSLYCNVTDSDNGSSIVVLGNNGGGDIRANDTEGSMMGLQYGTPYQTFAHTGTQWYKGNIFDESTPDNPKAINYSFSEVAKQNKYILGYLAGAQGTALYPYFVSDYNNWFYEDGAGSDYVCPGGSAGGGGTGGWTKEDLDTVIVADTAIVKRIKKEYGDGGILIDAKVKTIEHILDYWDLGGNMFNDVMQDGEYQEAIPLATLKHRLNEVLTKEIITKLEAKKWVDDIDNIISLINEYETSTFDPVGDTLILHTSDPEYQDLLYRLDTTKVRFSMQRMEKQLEVDSVVSELILLCDAVPRTGSVYANYYLDMLSMDMIMQKSDFSGFTQAQKNMINKVSEECAYKYPDPVFLARSLRSTYDEDMVQYADDCEDNIPIDLRSESNMSDFDIYPNPASDNITVVLKDRKEAKFEIINSVGKVIDVIDVNGSTNVNTKGYAAGIYFLRDKSGKLATKKFSIVK